jgi:hypothetical protein
MFADIGQQVTPKQYERHFAKWWKDYKPHLVLEDLPKWAQELIDKLEGPWARVPGYHGPTF